MRNSLCRALKWRTCGEVDVQEEHTSGVGTILGSHDGSLPFEDIVINRASRAIWGRISAEVVEFFVESTKSHW